MKTMETDSVFPPEVMAELQEAADRAAKGIRDPEVARKSRAHGSPARGDSP